MHREMLGWWEWVPLNTVLGSGDVRRFPLDGRGSVGSRLEGQSIRYRGNILGTVNTNRVLYILPTNRTLPP